MIFFNINYIVISLFFAISLIILVSKLYKVSSINEYILGKGNFISTSFVVSYMVNEIGGWNILIHVSEIFSNGLAPMITFIGLPLALILRGKFIIPNMAIFSDCLTLGHIMGKLYGNYARIITGILSLIYCVLIISLQFDIFGLLINSFFKIDSLIGVFLIAIIAPIYFFYSGMNSIIATDLFNAILICILIFTISYFSFGYVGIQVGGIANITKSININNINILNNSNTIYYFIMFLLLTIFQSSMVDPVIIQRLLMAKWGGYWQKSHYAIAILDAFFRVSLAITGLCCIIIYPNGNKLTILPSLIQHFLRTGFKGIMIFSFLFSVIMSTTCSYLHSASSSFVNDILSPILKISNNKTIIFFIRISSFLISLSCILICVYTNFISFDYYTLIKITEIILPFTIIPFMAGLFKMEVKGIAFNIASILTLLLFIILKLFIPPFYSKFNILIELFFNGAIFFYINNRLIRNKKK